MTKTPQFTSVPTSPPVRPRHWAASQRTSAVPLFNICRTGRTLALYTSTLTWPPPIGREAASGASDWSRSRSKLAEELPARVHSLSRMSALHKQKLLLRLLLKVKVHFVLRSIRTTLGTLCVCFVWDITNQREKQCSGLGTKQTNKLNSLLNRDVSEKVITSPANPN